MSVNETSTFKIDGWMIRSVATTATKFVTAMSHNGKSNVRVYNVGDNPKEVIIRLEDENGKENFKNINSVAIFYTNDIMKTTYVAAGGDSGTTYVWVLSEGTRPVQTMNNQFAGEGYPIRSLMMDNMYLLRLSDSKSGKKGVVYTLNVTKYEEIGSQTKTAVLGGGLKHISMHGSYILTVNDNKRVQLWSVGRNRNSIKTYSEENFNKLKDIKNIDLIALGKKRFVTVTKSDINLYDYDGNLKNTIKNDSKPTDVSMHMEKIVACFKDRAKVWNDDGEELAELKVEGATKVAVRGNTIIVIGTKKAHIFACVIASEPCPSRASEGLRPEEIPLYILKAITPEVKVHPQYGKLRY